MKSHQYKWPRSQPIVPSWLLGLALVAVLSYLFSGLAANVLTGEEFAFDRPAMEALHSVSSARLTTGMHLITISASGPTTVTLALVLVIRWRQAGRHIEAVILVVTLAGSAALGQILKALFARPRPQVFPWMTAAGGWSFPSGHTLNAVVLGGLIAWLVGRRLSGWRRGLLWVGAGLWAALVGLSRIYLGVHYPSDVLASMALGGVCLLAALYGYRAFSRIRLSIERD